MAFGPRYDLLAKVTDSQRPFINSSDRLYGDNDLPTDLNRIIRSNNLTLHL